MVMMISYDDEYAADDDVDVDDGEDDDDGDGDDGIDDGDYDYAWIGFAQFPCSQKVTRVANMQA